MEDVQPKSSARLEMPADVLQHSILLLELGEGQKAVEENYSPIKTVAQIQSERVLANESQRAVIQSDEITLPPRDREHAGRNVHRDDAVPGLRQRNRNASGAGHQFQNRDGFFRKMLEQKRRVALEKRDRLALGVVIVGDGAIRGHLDVTRCPS